MPFLVWSYNAPRKTWPGLSLARFREEAEIPSSKKHREMRAFLVDFLYSDSGKSPCSMTSPSLEAREVEETSVMRILRWSMLFLYFEEGTECTTGHALP